MEVIINASTIVNNFCRDVINSVAHRNDENVPVG